MSRVILAIVMIAGYGVLWFQAGWRVACAVFLIQWAINIEQAIKRGVID